MKKIINQVDVVEAIKHNTTISLKKREKVAAVMPKKRNLMKIIQKRTVVAAAVIAKWITLNIINLLVTKKIA